MKYTGTVTEAGTELNEYNYDVIDAIVKKDHISIDWDEEGEIYHAVLKTYDGGLTYRGIFGAPVSDPNWTIEATRYTATDKSVLLIAKWRQRDIGRAGMCLFELSLPDE